jgi:hypothetical protein
MPGGGFGGNLDRMAVHRHGILDDGLVRLPKGGELLTRPLGLGAFWGADFEGPAPLRFLSGIIRRSSFCWRGIHRDT